MLRMHVNMPIPASGLAYGPARRIISDRRNRSGAKNDPQEAVNRPRSGFARSIGLAEGFGPIDRICACDYIDRGSLWRWRTSNRMGVSGERETRAVHVTLVAQTHVPDEVFETLREQFSDEDRQAYVASGHYQPLEPDGDQLPGRASDELGKGEGFELVANGELAAKQRRHTTGSLPPHVTRASAIQPIPFLVCADKMKKGRKPRGHRSG